MATAISHQIKLLERHCGQPLFRRRPRPLALTWAGEQLFPVIRDGLESFREALSTVRDGGASGRLRITATNAFAALWLVSRLPKWREAHPSLKLDIVGTDAIIDLKAGEADIAIRYAVNPPPHGVATELMRDTFHVVASPSLVGANRRLLSPTELARFPLIEAAIAGHGVAICSDVLIARELASGALVQVSHITLPGYGFYVVHRDDHPKLLSIKAFIAWIRLASAVPQAPAVAATKRG